jgi:hypothetical protein
MRRRKNSQIRGVFDTTPFLASIRGFVDPEPLIEAEFARAKKELLATFEKDMGPIDRLRFRIELLRLRRQFQKLRYEAAKW